MKILVFSDSHGSVQNMIDAVYAEQPDQIVHLGDHISDAEQLREFCPQIPVACVPGNCDYLAQGPEEKVCIFGGLRFFITHGHRHGVKMGLTRLAYAAMEAGACAALFGHTHSAVVYEINENLTLFNPGSCGALSGKYGVIEIKDNKPLFLIKSIG